MGASISELAKASMKEALSQVMKPRIRTCIATGKAQPDAALLRVVVDPSNPTRIIADPTRSLPGRGAWITPTRQAVEQAMKRKAFGRALRVSGITDVSHVCEYVATLERRSDGIDHEGPNN